MERLPKLCLQQGTGVLDSRISVVEIVGMAIVDSRAQSDLNTVGITEYFLTKSPLIGDRMWTDVSYGTYNLFNLCVHGDSLLAHLEPAIAAVNTVLYSLAAPERRKGAPTAG